MTRRKPASQWMRRHVRDPFVKAAVKGGYRSRAAFKLMEIDQRDRLFKPGMVVVDLGAAPGGWSQVAQERVRPGGRVIALDRLSMQPLSGVSFLCGDIADDSTAVALDEALGNGSADLVLSDMAPNLTGVGAVDEARSQALVRAALDFARSRLKPGGALLVKVFHGCGLEAVIQEMKEAFAQVAVRKPAASRSQSSEAYVLCRGLLQRAASSVV
jgi:23S rRNA (uridine2552-2'-O)-methyltransferase